MIVLIGLGNVGNEYANTRHNIGFMVVDKIANDYQFPVWKVKNKYEYTKKNIGDISVMLVKPSTFMNLSGEAVSDIVSFYKMSLNDLVVIHDDLDLELGRIKIKYGGGNAGHNGLRNIDKLIGIDYFRIRIGISKPKFLNISDYVLGKFNKDELDIIDNKINLLSSNFPNIISKDFDKILNSL